MQYNETQKDLPSDQLYHLFKTAGWTKRNESENILKNFNKPFINSALVISAWDENRLVGVIRVLSDQVVRSVIYDLVVDPEYQGKGIAKELVNRCINTFPNTEWILQTTEEITPYYEKLGFIRSSGVFLKLASIRN